MNPCGAKFSQKGVFQIDKAVSSKGGHFLLGMGLNECSSVVVVLVLLVVGGYPGADAEGERCERSLGSNGGRKNDLSDDIVEEWPMIRHGTKRYYIGHFFKANWYKAHDFCRFHAMQLASVESQVENDVLEKTIQEFGLGHEHFWTSGTDQGEEGIFTWFGNGRPVTFTNWNTGEPNNFRYENGEEEHCLELWNRDGKGLRWNDTPCSFQTYFICER